MEWLYYGTDMAQIKDIQRKFGSIPLKKYPFSPILWHKFYLPYIKGIKVVKPLNYIPYIRKGCHEALGRDLWMAGIRPKTFRVTVHQVL